MQRTTVAFALAAIFSSCASPPAAIQATPAPTVASELPYPGPSPLLGGIRSPASASVGAAIELRADGRDANGWFQGVRWTLDDPAMARFSGPDVGASATLQVLAPGPIRVRASRDGAQVVSLLAGVAAPAPGRPIDLRAYGIDEDGKMAGSHDQAGSRIVTTEAGWRAFTAAFPGVGRIPAPAQALKDARAPVDFATSSLVVLYEVVANANDPVPVLTRIDPAPPGLAEVIRPRTNHYGGKLALIQPYLKIYEVAKMPDGAEMRVVRE